MPLYNTQNKNIQPHLLLHSSLCPQKAFGLFLLAEESCKSVRVREAHNTHDTMDFLLKKSWHPSRIQNVEKVWKAEQEAIAEKQRIMELQRKLQEERQIEELKRLSQSSSSTKSK